MIKKITLISVLALLCLNTNAQEVPIRPLLVGERMPDILLTNIINYETDTNRLSSFQNNYSRLVLFDFWNTFCQPCIRAFAKLDSLQQQHGHQLQIILVTYEDSAVVKEVVARWETANNKKLTLPILTKDSLLQQYIRRRFNPHYAWIAPDRVLLAQTAASFLTPEVMEAFLVTMQHDVDNRGYKIRDLKTDKTNKYE